MQHAPKKPFVSDKLAKRRKAHAKAKRILAFAVLVIVVAALGYFIYADRFQIRGVVVSGTQAVQGGDVVAAADGIISGKSLYVFPKRNIFLYSKKSLEAELGQYFPRLDTINIQIENKELAISVTERDPAYLWCGESIPATRQASFESICYFVDGTGYIFSLAPQFSDSVYMRIYTSLGEVTSADVAAAGEIPAEQTSINPIGQYAMKGTVLARVATFAKQITSTTFKPSAFSITPDGDALIFLYRDSDTSPAIRYNPLHDPLTVVAQFKSAITTEPLKGKLSTSLSTLDYIDVRFPNKIFYKFNDDIGQQQDNAKDKQNE
ncbi:MAG: hypothetical protein KBB70_01215 [Candidatus Pacebacteria bacterium]|nr:hypothetical protein [Candidatus Paceibacterota bacterium]